MSELSYNAHPMHVLDFICNPDTNPATGCTIKRNGKLFDKYVDLCKDSSEVEELCKVFVENPAQNPINSEPLRFNCRTYSVLKALCAYYGIYSHENIDRRLYAIRPAWMDFNNWSNIISGYSGRYAITPAKRDSELNDETNEEMYSLGG